MAKRSQRTASRRRRAWRVVLLAAAALWLLVRSADRRRLAKEIRRLEDENHRLERESHTDSLTGLRNRRYFLSAIEQDIALVDRIHADGAAEGEIVEGRDHVLLFFDLDDFKEINDLYGHGIGDHALVQVRQVLLRCFRESDTLIRWGGDEFLVVGRLSDRAAAGQLAERLRREIAEHSFQLGGGRAVRLQCSVGFACYPFLRSAPDRIHWRQVLTLADRAQYIAKNSGRNAWVGLFETPSTAELPVDELIYRVRTGVDGLLADGYLSTQTSFSQDRPARRSR